MRMGMGPSIPPRAQGRLRSAAPPSVRFTAAGAKPGGGGMGGRCTTTPEHPRGFGDETPVPSPESLRDRHCAASWSHASCYRFPFVPGAA